MIALQSRAGSPWVLQHVGQRTISFGPDPALQRGQDRAPHPPPPACASRRQLSYAVGGMSQFDNVLTHFALKYSFGIEKHSLPLGLPLCKTNQF